MGSDGWAGTQTPQMEMLPQAGFRPLSTAQAPGPQGSGPQEVSSDTTESGQLGRALVSMLLTGRTITATSPGFGRTIHVTQFLTAIPRGQ